MTWNLSLPGQSGGGLVVEIATGSGKDQVEIRSFSVKIKKRDWWYFAFVPPSGLVLKKGDKISVTREDELLAVLKVREIKGNEAVCSALGTTCSLSEKNMENALTIQKLNTNVKKTITIPEKTLSRLYLEKIYNKK